MTNHSEETPQDESENILNMYSKLVDRDDILTKDYVRHKTRFNTNIHKLSLSELKPF